MRLSRFLAGCVAGGILGLALPPHGATASTWRGEPDQQDTWLVGRRPPASLVLRNEEQAIVVHFNLPADAAQGPDSWYTFRLRATVRFRPGGQERGSARVAATVNRAGAALVTLQAQPHGVRIFYDGYLTGAVNHIATERSVSVDYENYVQVKGISGGGGTFTIFFQDHGRLVESVHVDPMSGLSRTSIPPGELKIAAPDEVRAEPGRSFDIPYQVSRRGNRPDRPITVSGVFAGGPIRLTHSSDTFQTVGDGRSGTLRAVAAEVGRYQVRLTGSGGYNTPSKIVNVVVSPPSGMGASTKRLLAAATLAAVGITVLCAARIGRRRSRRMRSARLAGRLPKRTLDGKA